MYSKEFQGIPNFNDNIKILLKVLNDNPTERQLDKISAIYESMKNFYEGKIPKIDKKYNIQDIMNSSHRKNVNNEMKTISHVDLETYSGLWYEIARIPSFFEKNNSYNATAEYSYKDGILEIINRNDNGEESKAFAIPYDEGKLLVFFYPPFGATYWIIDISDDYSQYNKNAYVVVTDEENKYLWILSRSPSMNIETLNILLQKLRNNFDINKLVFSTR